MLEYILFDEKSWRSFSNYLHQLGLEPDTSVTEDGWLIALPEYLDDALDEKIEAYYDQLLEDNEAMVAEMEGDAHQFVAGVNVTLADGRVVQAIIDPKLMQRLLDAVSPQELGDLVDAVAAAVENPDKRPFCRR